MGRLAGGAGLSRPDLAHRAERSAQVVGSDSAAPQTAAARIARTYTQLSIGTQLYVQRHEQGG